MKRFPSRQMSVARIAQPFWAVNWWKGVRLFGLIDLLREFSEICIVEEALYISTWGLLRHWVGLTTA